MGGVLMVMIDRSEVVTLEQFTTYAISVVFTGLAWVVVMGLTIYFLIVPTFFPDLSDSMSLLMLSISCIGGAFAWVFPRRMLVASVVGIVLLFTIAEFIPFWQNQEYETIWLAVVLIPVSALVRIGGGALLRRYDEYRMMKVVGMPPYQYFDE